MNGPFLDMECSPSKLYTQGQAGGRSFPSVQWLRCVCLVSNWIRVVNLLPPLVPLMVDQVSGLQKRGVNAAILSGNTNTVTQWLSA